MLDTIIVALQMTISIMCITYILYKLLIITIKRFEILYCKIEELEKRMKGEE